MGNLFAILYLVLGTLTCIAILWFIVHLSGRVRRLERDHQSDQS